MRDLRGITALLFDKDGTLFDFHRSWSAWTTEVLDELADGDRDHAAALGEVIGFDRAAVQFRPGAPFIAGTLDEVCALLLPHLQGWSAGRLRDHAVARASAARMVPPVPLAPLLEGLRARGLALGVATNDAEAAARAQLAQAGIAAQFDLILGCDSGPEPKPAPDMLLHFADRLGLMPARVAMVGDSTHDLLAGRAAGMVTVAVLTGIAGRAELAPYADHVLGDVGDLPGLLG
ncbi:MAG: HAD family hydrolase [Rhodobacteraceae bacterium]|nr:HAD family hydrolase [Paracoccaceae bacterium]